MVNSKTRIDLYLARKYGVSRTKISQVIRDGLVSVNGKKINSPSLQVDADGEDKINFDDSTLKICHKIDTKLIPIKIPLNIVYEDEYLLVVNKPSGMLSHPTKYHEQITLANALAGYLSSYGNERGGIVHRLDRDTSGLILIAKDLSTLQQLQQELQNKKVDRIYLAIVHGEFRETQGTIDAKIGYCGHKKMKMKIDGVNAKEAITKFFVLDQTKQLAFVACQLLTGRTHQIRVHLSYINHPVLNDPLYGHDSQKSSYCQFLHAYMLKFIHPWTKKLIQVQTNPEQTFFAKMHESGLKFNPEFLHGKI